MIEKLLNDEISIEEIRQYSIQLNDQLKKGEYSLK